jgi:hypothetical protein
VADRGSEYGVPDKPGGKGEGVAMRIGAGVIVSVNVALAMDGVGKALSVTVTLNAAVPYPVGVPAITPLEAMPRPAGNAPEVDDQLYGAIPPLAARVCE